MLIYVFFHLPLFCFLDDHSRVVLTPISNFEEFSHDYINASYIDVSFVIIFPKFLICLIMLILLDLVFY